MDRHGANGRRAVVIAGAALAVGSGAVLFWASPSGTTLAAALILVVVLGATGPAAPPAVRSVQRSTNRTRTRAAAFIGLPLVAGLVAVVVTVGHPAATLALVVALLVGQWGAAVLLARRDRRSSQPPGGRLHDERSGG